jgi:GT2 family glycosyltransferase
MEFKTSVIILSYNNFEETTGPCLASLFKNGDDNRFDIIVVDNNSSDGSAEKIEKAAAGHNGVKIIINRENRGFAGGNNDGVELAIGENLILLNSDTLVPPGELFKLSTLMQENSDWAMLGPVTNQAGNEQKIYTAGKDIVQILQEGDRWCANSRKDVYPSERLDFFCVAIRKRIYEKFGGLDERFGAGYYEDTDFSLQVKKAGLKMMFTEDAFIYHKAGKSFSREGTKKVKLLMRENKKKLMRKHKGNVKLLHMRQCNTNILKAYVGQRKNLKKNCGCLEYKFNNRMRLAREIFPNNPLKKWRYAALLKQLDRSFFHG